jgi:hypothetical protein
MTGATLSFKLRRPCPHCPFRTDVPPFLRGDRAQDIARDLLGGAEFHCHQTLGEADDDDEDGALVSNADSQFCAGALIMLEHSGTPNQAMRLGERLNAYDPERLDMAAPVHRSTVEFVRHHAEQDDDEDRPCCEIAEAGCEAPAGWLEGDGVVPNLDPGEVAVCVGGCGQYVCESCTVEGDRHLCPECAEYEEPE